MNETTYIEEYMKKNGLKTKENPEFYVESYTKGVISRGVNMRKRKRIVRKPKEDIIKDENGKVWGIIYECKK